MEAGQPPPPAQPPPPPARDPRGGHRVAGIVLAVLFALIAAGLVALTVAIMGFTLCEDELESGCSLDSSSAHTLKVIFGWGASIAAVVAVASAIAWRKGGSSSRLVAAVAATIALTSLLFIL